MMAQILTKEPNRPFFFFFFFQILGVQVYYPGTTRRLQVLIHYLLRGPKSCSAAYLRPLGAIGLYVLGNSQCWKLSGARYQDCVYTYMYLCMYIYMYSMYVYVYVYMCRATFYTLYVCPVQLRVETAFWAFRLLRRQSRHKLQRQEASESLKDACKP